jgi:hypothetical protein
VRRSRARFAFAALAVLAGSVFGTGARASHLLLYDDFEGSAHDPSKWFQPVGDGTFFGRTHIRPPSSPLTVAGGVCRLQLDTHNPSAKVSGDSFFGSEIVSQDLYTVGAGLEFEARVRFVAPLPGGLVGSLFSFVFIAPNNHDEIDFELLSNDVVASQERVLTNVFDDADFSLPGDPVFANVSGLDLTAFNTYRVEWYPDRIDWFVNNVKVRTETDIVPNADQRVRLNFWAPDTSFADAYDASLQPVADAENNDVYFYEVDWVQVSRPALVPSMSPMFRGLALLSLATLGLLAIAFTRKARR